MAKGKATTGCSPCSSLNQRSFGQVTNASSGGGGGGGGSLVGGWTAPLLGDAVGFWTGQENTIALATPAQVLPDSSGNGYNSTASFTFTQNNYHPVSGARWLRTGQFSDIPIGLNLTAGGAIRVLFMITATTTMTFLNYAQGVAGAKLSLGMGHIQNNLLMLRDSGAGAPNNDFAPSFQWGIPFRPYIVDVSRDDAGAGTVIDRYYANGVFIAQTPPYTPAAATGTELFRVLGYTGLLFSHLQLWDRSRSGAEILADAMAIMGA